MLELQIEYDLLLRSHDIYALFVRIERKENVGIGVEFFFFRAPSWTIK